LLAVCVGKREMSPTEQVSDTDQYRYEFCIGNDQTKHHNCGKKHKDDRMRSITDYQLATARKPSRRNKH